MRLFSPLTLRFLAVNLAAPVLLVLGLLFLDEYQDTLIATELDALRTQGELIAAAIGEGAVVVAKTRGKSNVSDDDDMDFGPSTARRVIDPESARQLVRHLSNLANVRSQLFDRSGALVADTRLLQGSSGAVQVLDLPPIDEGPIMGLVRRMYENTIGRYAYDRGFDPYVEPPKATAADFSEAAHALEKGEPQSRVRLRGDRQKILSVAVPVQFYKQIVGTVLVSRDGSTVDKRLFAVRGSILGMFAWVLAFTVLTSIYLASTIARPVRRLAAAAMQVRQAKNRRYPIPDLTGRSDEIGELSAALREMTESLWQRLDAIEHFAADVAHEIKNPLTSLRSAVETVARVKDPEQQKKLMSIIMEDVTRLDRLISEISDASRLDAELSRAEMEPVDIVRLVHALADVQNANDNPAAPKVELITEEPTPGKPAEKRLMVPGLETRLGQVFRNLISNAVSFSPPAGTIMIRTARDRRHVMIMVEDQGPGIPSGKEDDIFNRFYTERPEGEAFGKHSGLGLSISKQIVEAHRGTITAENIIGDDKQVKGARFIVRLPT
ncbi:MAG: sensor histidine kinase [Rhodospirillaceae bacterium]|nr:sensor histidine kinase [Rhodospirillaceae bacterium]